MGQRDTGVSKRPLSAAVLERPDTRGSARLCVSGERRSPAPNLRVACAEGDHW
ncbi:hypothetical protein EMIHUDRAFT_351507 [Emiliania huxleyi CCMP1516]|uniref:Uncharacterized protein n=2 Tax=Emiliania huxleyi TaxID=2903 RepID=A0A0D3KV54_EMIH1|nr:hypothetical protein EMIHUDRAFT_351507 [Emiliania huxleyi CCMP1516]EOD39639.1 hypothetical protein EMIHUDRAFT_351507 [Emiliania huxleyi CCMP1516]|eukprot:XP_005792068.1 hypothetical protein EMIHUDRAFT_351507 [Emiliania huxleyi CCMP1516]